jgi:Domain of unknown function (DUF4340)
MIKRNTWILLAIFIVVLGAALLIQKTNILQPAATPSATLNPPLLGNSNDPITGIILSDQHGLDIVSKLGSDNQWAIQQPAGLQISQGSMQLILSDLNGISIQATLLSQLPLESTGLQLPTYSITLTYQSGQTHLIKVGNLTSTQSGYYVQLDSGKTVIVNQSSIDNVVGVLKSMTYTPTPTLTTSTTKPQSTPVTVTPSATPIPSLTPTP